MKAKVTHPGCGLIIFKVLVVALLTVIEANIFTWLFGPPAAWDVLLLAMILYATVKVGVS